MWCLETFLLVDHNENLFVGTIIEDLNVAYCWDLGTLESSQGIEWFADDVNFTQPETCHM